jgi:hypothetical protein
LGLKLQGRAHSGTIAIPLPLCDHPFMAGDSQHNKNLFNIMVIGTAISFGILGGIVFSMKDFFHGDVTFNFTYKTLIGFILGFVVGWVFWQVVKRRIGK